MVWRGNVHGQDRGKLIDVINDANTHCGQTCTLDLNDPATAFGVVEGAVVSGNVATGDGGVRFCIIGPSDGGNC